METFILRIPSPLEGRKDLSGKIQHVQSGEETIFKNEEELIGFLLKIVSSKTVTKDQIKERP